MKEYVITFEKSEQITEDKWVIITPCLKVTESTTVAQIESFYRKHLKSGFMQITLTELQNISE